MRFWSRIVILLELFVIMNTKLSPDKHRERNKVRTKPKQSLKYKDCGEYHSATFGFTLRNKRRYENKIPRE